jgi:hypothetical protein
MDCFEWWVKSMAIPGIGVEKFTPEQTVLANDIMTKFSSFKLWALAQVNQL